MQPKLVSVGAGPSNMIRSDGNLGSDPTPSDALSVIRAIKAAKKCTFSWHPRTEPNRATLFRDAKKSSETLYQFILMFSYEATEGDRLYLKGTKVKDVRQDPRFGDEVVDVTCTSADDK
jgi:hypothetical protein